MKHIKVNNGMTIPLGYLGENEARVIEFDISDWIETFGEGTFSLLNLLPCSEAPYPCVVTTDGATLCWKIKSGDVSRPGFGKCEVVYTIDNVVAKSQIYDTKIDMALSGGGEIPEPWEDWVQSVISAGADAQAARYEWTHMTAEAETLAAGTPATASYMNGVLSLGIPQGDKGDKGDKGDPGTGGGASSWDDLTDKPFNTIGENLKVVNGALSVDTAPNVQQDNTKPITSAAVYVEVGNINALLALI